MKANKIFLFLLSGLAALTVNAQNLTVKGTITDGASGDPVPFASVVVKGTGAWCTSDADGNFSVEAPANATLSVESLGYLSAEVAVNGKNIMNITIWTSSPRRSSSVTVCSRRNSSPVPPCR